MKTKFRQNIRIAYLLANGFSENELMYLVNNLSNKGVHQEVLSIEKGIIKSGTLMLHELDNIKPSGKPVAIQQYSSIEKLKRENFDMAILLGDAYSNYKLASDHNLVEQLKKYYTDGGMIAALGNGTRLLLELNNLSNKTISTPDKFHNGFHKKQNNIKTNSVKTDGNLITCDNINKIEDFATEIAHALEVTNAQKSFSKRMDEIEKQHTS